MELRESIRSKLRRAMMLTSACVLGLTITSFVVYEAVSFRRSHVDAVRSIGNIVAENATAALAFENQEDALSVLRSLRTEPTIRRAAIYNSMGNLFAVYPSSASTNDFPVIPGADRVNYERGRLIVVTPVQEQEKRMGTLLVESDLSHLYESLRLYAVIVLLVTGSSISLAYFLSSSLQRKISTPLLDLARVARQVSERRDYSVRAEKHSEDEIGVLTDTFNHMLGQIAERDTALRQNTERLRLALEASQTGTWSWDTRANILIWDEHLHRLFGLAPGQFGSTYEAFLERIHPEDRPGMQRVMARAMEKKREFSAEYRTIWPDGSVHYMSSRGRAIEGADGYVRGMAGVTINVTESKKAEQALRESEERFRTMADAAPVMIWTARNNGDWEYCNRSWLQFTGRSLADQLGSGWKRSISPADLVEVEAVYGRSLEKREPFDIEFRLLRADGEFRWIRTRGVPRLKSDGELSGFIGSCIDVTDVKQSQSELERRVMDRTAELAETNRELEAFTYSVSHDLRAPLRHINAYAQILEEELGGSNQDEVRRYLARIRQGAKNMGMLVDDLLNLARVGRQELAYQASDLNAMVSELVQEFRNESSGRNIEWNIHDLGTAECDPGLMRQVFTNLLSNAVKYTRPREKAVIEIGRSRERGQDIIFVRDNGVGFNMKYAAKLFGVFQRLHRAEDFEGTGVGLATVERIVRKHGGRIWAESELDKGATFYFTLSPDRLSQSEALAS